MNQAQHDTEAVFCLAQLPISAHLDENNLRHAGYAREIVEDLTIFAYSPQMLVAEKLRAICQQMPEYTRQLKKSARPRGRDFLDIYSVSANFNIDFGSPDFHRTVKRVFQAKRVDVRLLSKIAAEATREYHRPDFVSIAPTVRPDFELQDYDFYYDYVLEKCRMLETLWNV